MYLPYHIASVPYHFGADYSDGISNFFLLGTAAAAVADSSRNLQALTSLLARRQRLSIACTALLCKRRYTSSKDTTMIFVSVIVTAAYLAGI